MTPEEMKTIMQQMAEDTCTGDLDHFYHYCAEEFIFRRLPFPDVVGKEANRKADEGMLAAFTNNQMVVHEIIVEGDTAALHYTWDSDHTGTSPTLGIPATGKHVRLSGCMLYYWKGGKVVKIIDYTDMLGMMYQLGLIPAEA